MIVQWAGTTGRGRTSSRTTSTTSRFGFAVTSIEDSSFWEHRVTYQSATSAVAVIRSNETTRVEVQLMRLVDGGLPEYPIFIVDSVPVNTFYLDDLLLLRMPDAADRLRAQHGLSKRELNAQLEFWAASLRNYGGDLLRGDLGVLDELESIVRERAAQSPPEIVIWLPEGTAPEEAAKEVASARAGVPLGVNLVTRWYRRGRIGDRNVLDG